MTEDERETGQYHEVRYTVQNFNKHTGKWQWYAECPTLKEAREKAASMSGIRRIAKYVQSMEIVK